VAAKLSELISLWHETALAGSRLESAARFPDPKRTVPAAKFFRVSLWPSNKSQVALPAAGKSSCSICLRVKAQAEDSLLNVRVFSGLLFVVRMFQIGPKQEPVNRREDGIDPSVIRT